MTRLHARGASFGYDDRRVVDHLDLEVPDRRLTVLVGPNACGKSTLLRGLANLLRPATGAVTLDGEAIHRMPAKRLARRLGLLPQSPPTPEALTVAGLVRRGRFPHQRLLRPFSDADRAAETRALERTGLAELAEAAVDELSGGQRQRAWIALALAQETPLMLLDEPTTYLDLRHQLEVLDLLAALNADDGRTVAMVLHDLGHAARYATHLVVMRAGHVVAAGPPGEVLTEELVADVFGVACRVVPDPVTGTPLVVPLSATDRARHGTPTDRADPAAPAAPADPSPR